MRLRLLLNIGKKDAQRLGLGSDLLKLQAGKSVDVDDDAAAEMLRSGWATDKPDDTAPAPEAVPHNSAGLPSVVGDAPAPARVALPPTPVAGPLTAAPKGADKPGEKSGK